MKPFLLAILLVFTGLRLNAQNPAADSLQNLLTRTPEPIARFHLIDKILESINSSAGSVDSAYCIELLKIAQKQHDDGLMATSYNWIGTFFSLVKGDNATALDYYFKAIPWAIKSNDKRRISSIYFDMALTYMYLQNDEEMLRYNMLGGEYLPDPSHPKYYYMLVQYQRTQATYFLNKNMPDSALHYAQALVETSRKANTSLFEYSGLHLTAAAFALKGENELAEIYFNKALTFSQPVESNSAKLRFGYSYLPYLLANKRYPEAKEQAHKLLGLGKQYNNNNLMLAGAGYLRKIFDATKNTDSAYYYSRMEADINARIFSQENGNKIQALAFNEQIRIMEDEANRAEAEQKRSQNIQYALLALSIITFVILFLTLSRRHITNTKIIQFLGVVALLVVFEFLNLLLHPFLEKVTHHNPILMLLALVCIAALLVPLHHRLEKWATHKLVEKNKQIRLAAAKRTIQQLEDPPGSKSE